MNITVKSRKDLKNNAKHIFMEALKRNHNEDEDGRINEDMLTGLDNYIDEYNSYCLDNFKIEYIEQFGGEGQGGIYYLIYKITETTSGISSLFKINGYYSSYSDCEYESIEEVQAIKKEITVYDSI